MSPPPSKPAWTALLAALEDAAATLLAIRAMSRDPSEWPDSADHIFGICGESLALMQAAIAGQLADGEVERVARILCRQAGYDPDGGPKYGFGWINFEKNAREILAALSRALPPVEGSK